MIKNEQKCRNKQKIMTYDSCKIQMQQTVYCALRAASGAIITGNRIKQATWKNFMFGRIQNKKEDCQSSKTDKQSNS